MQDFRMPDSYYDPPEYDGCEDCLCEDPEYPQPVCTTCKEPMGDDSCPTPFACGEDADEAPCDCKCHNLPPEPDEYDLARDREDDRLREERDNLYDGGY